MPAKTTVESFPAQVEEFWQSQNHRSLPCKIYPAKFWKILHLCELLQASNHDEDMLIDELFPIQFSTNKFAFGMYSDGNIFESPFDK